MRGDLVFEKLGEIDPALVADALPSVMMPVSLDNIPMAKKQKKKSMWRAWGVMAASILLVALLLVGGGLALSRPGDTTPSETTADDPNGKELTYQGIVSIGDFGALTGSDELEVMGNELKARFTVAAPMEDVCECDRDLTIQIGNTTLTYNREHGCFRDGDTGQVYLLREQDKDYINGLLDELVVYSPVLSFTYEYDTLRRGDDFVFSVGWFESLGSIFKIDKVYLRYEGDDVAYVTPEFFTVGLESYRIRIMDDAPYGKYTLVAEIRSVSMGRNIEMEIPSETGAIEIVPNEKEPAYDFDFDPAQMSAQTLFRNDTLSLNVALINLGVDIHRFGLNTILHPKAELRIQQDGESLSFALTDELILDDGHQLRTIRSGETGDSVPYSLQITEELPAGVYDLVLSFEGHEKVFEDALRIMDTVILHRGDSFGLTDFTGSSYRFSIKQGDYKITFYKNGGVPTTNIPLDAPAGWYDLVYTDVPAGWEDLEDSIVYVLEDYVYIPDEDMDLLLECDLGQVTVKPGDVFSCKFTVTNQGNPINIYIPNNGMGLTLALESVENGTWTTASPSPIPDDRQPGNYTFETGESFTNTYTFYLFNNIPEGTYDLVMICGDYTVVIEDSVIIETP